MSRQKNAKTPAVNKTAGKKKSVKPQRQTAAKPVKKSGAGKQTQTPGNTGQKSKTAEKEKFPHFRYHKKTQHPALVVGEQKGKKTDRQGKECETDEYKYRKVMHSDRDGRHLNEKITPNPNPQDPEPMYIGKRVRHDEKKNFGEKYPWKYPKKDEKKEVPPHGCK